MKLSTAITLTLFASGVAIAGGALRLPKKWLFVAWLTPGLPPPGPFG